jgi:hypothetical protein
MSVPNRGSGPNFDRALLLHGSKRNVILTLREVQEYGTLALTHGNYESLIDNQAVPSDHVVIVFVAPPWGTALDEKIGLDLRCTRPPITDIFARIGREYVGHKVVFATQAYEKVNPESLMELRTMLDWSELQVYDLNLAGRNHGLLLGTRGWKPDR